MQHSLWDEPARPAAAALPRRVGGAAPPPLLSLEQLLGYAVIIVAFSGGKDSVACVLHLLELGVPAGRIELWHHEVDGREGSALMDWPCTPAYCRRFAEALGLRIYFSWRVGGLEGEILREDAAPAAIRFETPEGRIVTAAGHGRSVGTRRRFPAPSRDPKVRWCSSTVKIDVMERALRRQARFLGQRTLVVTGERGQESDNRARYKELQPHRARSSRRPVDHARLVLRWDEAHVWAILERHRINPHPCYRLGWGRCSCALCIFANANQVASHRQVHPAQFKQLAQLEGALGWTIKPGVSLPVLADRGTPYPMEDRDRQAALATTFSEPIVLEPGTWRLPRGAFGDGCGPT